MRLNTTITFATKLDALGMGKPNFNSVKTRQSKERLPSLLISQVNQYDFVNYQKIGSFLKSMNKIKFNSIFGLTELATEVLILNAVTI